MSAPVRDTARTRRVVLDAAAAVVTEHGAGVSLDAIARRAGISKGGLLHHFRSREQLLVAVAEDLLEHFAVAVREATEPTDHAPGRLVRGYVRACFDELRTDQPVPEHLLLGAALVGVPGVRELLRADARRWRAAFAADGLDPQRVLLLTAAADGAGLAGVFEGDLDPERLQRVRDLLLALSREDGPLVAGDVPPDGN
ncbi:TetR/AcrR family transcriptional regulator [Modestobacter sp. VKM Ac-2986]|uniref:TetR/AcrR family transcriptional regulator n=1 Tax=Modestobacter sp. VKM Ac-2986 TaxID=3004140 RepID=UPI0022AB8984|nr:TetR/AcrR family transcriptional regulator [Modestobacter sp. VKM Ac-2986]MCZ2830681.1 TetR/AcrR family transcriptional regulator [Modestobacter sp. VKM Ac-2986]